MLYVDKYRPKQLKNLTFHDSLTPKLQLVKTSKISLFSCVLFCCVYSFSQMAEKGDFPHLLFYGPSGAGQREIY